jgi:hypothetical protein
MKFKVNPQNIEFNTVEKGKKMNFTEEFLKNVKDHEMTILKDDGEYRHLRFKRADSGQYYFDIVTFPYHLVITGNMGEYVFGPCDDILRIFRGHELEDLSLYYFNQKCLAGHKSEWSSDVFWDEVRGILEEPCEESGMALSEAMSILEKNIDDASMDIACQQFAEFDFEGELGFDVPFEPTDSFGSCLAPTYTYEWACHAGVWGTQKFYACKERKD